MNVKLLTEVAKSADELAEAVQRAAGVAEAMTRQVAVEDVYEVDLVHVEWQLVQSLKAWPELKAGQLGFVKGAG